MHMSVNVAVNQQISLQLTTAQNCAAEQSKQINQFY